MKPFLLVLILILSGSLHLPFRAAARPPLPLLHPALASITAYARTPQPLPAPYTLRWRVGVGVSHAHPASFRWPASRPGWFHNWYFGIFNADGSDHQPLPLFDLSGSDRSFGMDYTPMINTRGGKISQPAARIAQAAAANPGLTWLIGNEPDIREQDHATPEQYAAAYHDAYQAIKAADPSAAVLAGNLSQITPLRLRYLDAVWAAYQEMYGQEMPVDVWGMHAFVLREEAGVWGVDIPPGLPDAPTQGMLWTVEEHDDLALVADQVQRMRRWMADHGQQEKPLWITEYGILMPADYGFTPERVADFMVGSFDLFRSLNDPALGLTEDEHHLVQRWLWFSSRSPVYPTGDLFDADGRPTGLMWTMARYLESAEGEVGGRRSEVGSRK